MNILNVYPYPDVNHGSERAMHLGAWAIRNMGHKIFLLHGMANASETAVHYDGELRLPVIFDRTSKFTPRGLREAEAHVNEYCTMHCMDLIHVHGYPRTETLARLAKRHTVVVSVHVPLCPNGARYLWKDRQACSRDIGLGCFTEGYLKRGCGHLGNQQPQDVPGFLRGMVEDRLLHGAIGQCTRIVAPSEWMRQQLIQDGMPAQRTCTLYVAISGDESADRGVDRAALEGPPVIAFVGRLVDFKGPDHLLKASQQISFEHRLWFIGDGPMRPELELMTDALGLRDRTTFFGSMLPEQITHYRFQSEVVVVPSLWQEVFGMVGPEAMLMRLPVVAYHSGGIPEWLQDGVTGLLVEAGDVAGLAKAITKILTDATSARELGENGRKVALAWQPKHHAANLIKVYQEALEPRPCVIA